MGTLRSTIRRGMMDGPAATLVRQAGDAWVQESRARAPVKSGRLRNGITMRPGRKEVAVESTAPYSSYVDQGTRHQAAQPFWLPGRRAAEDVLRRGKLRP